MAEEKEKDLRGYDAINPFDYGMTVEDVHLVVGMRHPVLEM